MGKLPEEWIHDLLQRVDIREVIGRYVQLKEKGGRLWASCPFHPDKTPSFSVSPDKGMFYCFSCHKGGSVIQFLSEIEHISFREACERLAEEQNLPLPTEAFSERSAQNKKKIERILEMNRLAARHFAKTLASPAGSEALAYLRDRGLSVQDIRKNGLGFAVDDWHAVGNLLRSHGYSGDEIAEAGLQKNKNGRSYDSFRNRIMFPILDLRSRVVGFGGRVMDRSEPKYLNTGDTPAFNKRRNLYHLNVARTAREPCILLMEGYMDVISASHYGFESAAASLGTALTRDQVWMLKRLGRQVLITYDGDSAGRKAALRAAQLLGEGQVDTRVVVIPGGMDPDEFLRAQGTAAFESLLRKAMDPLVFRFSELRRGFDLTDGTQKMKYVQTCTAILREQTSAVARENYARLLAEQTGFSSESIMRDLGEPDRTEPVTSSAARIHAASGADRAAARAENYVAAYAAAYPERMPELLRSVSSADFENPANAAIFDAVAVRVRQGVTPQPAEILDAVPDGTQREHAGMLFERIDDLAGHGKQPHIYVQGCVARMNLRAKQKQLTECRKEYSQLVASGAPSELVTELSTRLRDLQHEIGTLRQRMVSAAG